MRSCEEERPSSTTLAVQLALQSPDVTGVLTAKLQAYTAKQKVKTQRAAKKTASKIAGESVNELVPQACCVQTGKNETLEEDKLDLRVGRFDAGEEEEEGGDIVLHEDAEEDEQDEEDEGDSGGGSCGYDDDDILSDEELDEALDDIGTHEYEDSESGGEDTCSDTEPGRTRGHEDTRTRGHEVNMFSNICNGMVDMSICDDEDDDDLAISTEAHSIACIDGGDCGGCADSFEVHASAEAPEHEGCHATQRNLVDEDWAASVLEAQDTHENGNLSGAVTRAHTF